MDYSVKDVVLKSLVGVLKPVKKIEKMEPIDSKLNKFILKFFFNFYKCIFKTKILMKIKM